MFSIPQATYLSLGLFFSASFLVFGIMELVFAIQNKDNLDNWGWYLVGALLDLFVGIILFFFSRRWHLLLCPILLDFH